MRKFGIIFRGDDGKAVDIIVVDQSRGPTVSCDWIWFGTIALGGDPDRRVTCCQLAGSTGQQLMTPDGWTFDQWRKLLFVQTEDVDHRLAYLGEDNGVGKFVDRRTGKDWFGTPARYERRQDGEN